MRLLDLFSGIGAFALGLEHAGFTPVAFCEIAEFPRAVLAKHWPEVPCYDDIRTLTAARLAADGITVDAICGGFPCQDLSTSGPGGGLDGKRSGLWREFARLIGELRPSFVFVENSPELLDGWLGDILGTMAALGYDAEWHCIPASAVGAPHRRDRIWIVAYTPSGRQQGQGQRIKSCSHASGAFGQAGHVVDAFHGRALPFVCRGHDGPTGRMDELTALGNSIVPQIPEMIARQVLGFTA